MQVGQLDTTKGTLKILKTSFHPSTFWSAVHFILCSATQISFLHSQKERVCLNLVSSFLVYLNFPTYTLDDAELSVLYFVRNVTGIKVNLEITFLYGFWCNSSLVLVKISFLLRLCISKVFQKHNKTHLHYSEAMFLTTPSLVSEYFPHCAETCLCKISQG